MGKNLQLYFDAIGQRESGGDYGIRNNWGYLGKYQMGESALVDAGYYIKSLPDYNNDWTGKFTGKVRRVGKNELPTIYKISETTYQIDDSDLMSVNNNA